MPGQSSSQIVGVKNVLFGRMQNRRKDSVGSTGKKKRKEGNLSTMMGGTSNGCGGIDNSSARSIDGSVESNSKRGHVKEGKENDDLFQFLEEAMEAEKDVERSADEEEAMNSSDVTAKHLKRGKAIEKSMIDILSKVGK